MTRTASSPTFFSTSLSFESHVTNTDFCMLTSEIFTGMPLPPLMPDDSGGFDFEDDDDDEEEYVSGRRDGRASRSDSAIHRSPSPTSSVCHSLEWDSNADDFVVQEQRQQHQQDSKVAPVDWRSIFSFLKGRESKKRRRLSNHFRPVDGDTSYWGNLRKKMNLASPSPPSRKCIKKKGKNGLMHAYNVF